MKLDGTEALVTGATRGLGKALVAALAQAGDKRIHAGCRQRVQPPPLAPQTSVTPVQLDITDSKQIKAVTEAASGIRLLINNAGVLPRGGAMSVSESDLRCALDVNLIGTWQMVRNFAPVISANGGGVIVNVLSLISLQNAPFFSVYSAAKHAAWDMTQSLQSELAGSNVNLVPCFPGGIDTEMLAGVSATKAHVDDIARSIVDGISSGADEIFPDNVSMAIGPMLRKETG